MNDIIENIKVLFFISRVSEWYVTVLPVAPFMLFALLQNDAVAASEAGKWLRYAFTASEIFLALFLAVAAGAMPLAFGAAHDGKGNMPLICLIGGVIALIAIILTAFFIGKGLSPLPLILLGALLSVALSDYFEGFRQTYHDYMSARH